jgi:hypothetical protein
MSVISSTLWDRVFGLTVGWSGNRSFKLLLGRSVGSGSGTGRSRFSGSFKISNRSFELLGDYWSVDQKRKWPKRRESRNENRADFASRYWSVGASSTEAELAEAMEIANENSTHFSGSFKISNRSFQLLECRSGRSEAELAEATGTANENRSIVELRSLH